MKPPCFNCKYRESSCHAYCIAYARYRQYTDIKREERNRTWEVVNYSFESIAKSKNHSRKKGKRK